MLIGSGPTLSLLSVGQIDLSKNGNELILQKTRLGWVFTGNFTYNSERKMHLCKLTNTQVEKTSESSCKELQDILTKFWEIEHVTNNSDDASTICESEKHFIQNTMRDISGRFIVALPFKEPKKNLGESRSRALSQLLSLKKRFKRDPDYCKQYTAVINEYLELGHMSKVTSSLNSDAYYMPHHAVIKQSSTTTKLRVVFNASAKLVMFYLSMTY